MYRISAILNIICAIDINILILRAVLGLPFCLDKSAEAQSEWDHEHVTQEQRVCLQT